MPVGDALHQHRADARDFAKIAAYGLPSAHQTWRVDHGRPVKATRGLGEVGRRDAIASPAAI